MSLFGFNRLGLSISALFILALLMYIPTWMEEQPETQGSSENDALKPAYKAKNLTTTLYNQDGELNHKVFAESMEHYDQLGFVLFQQPKYTLYTENASSPWVVTAQEGTLYNNELIQLENSVVIENQTSDDFVKRLSTEYIQINLETKQMTSDQPVEILGTQYLILSNGFNANLRTQEYELLDHVQTTYSPSN
ncbi:lipopolysaccharide export system protein LptC [Alteromonas marina]|jgi:lipopolysaccharide export system protein LptC|uniref:Lipopolysaccharide export system protein LptC n=1 Tax=Alteromonas marina TaxID=203795 RepID=A0A0B3Y9D8_9ALTE|nr:LPS export ABC transporter periplasmic protein LptC [Alteromonas marina]KHT53367.1 lipopolysaccharide export system protein LptC [Alteromonas marina]|tara:strand:+ start:113 stop:691 length:579 start_codon:yes stop_codon:yes gene_type:complete